MRRTFLFSQPPGPVPLPGQATRRWTMTRDEAIAELIRIIRNAMVHLPLFVRERIEAAIKQVEEAK